MRDSNRIYTCSNRLAEIWQKVPDWRLSQMMINALAMYQNRHGTDAFYMEDEEFLDFLENFIDHYTNRK